MLQHRGALAWPCRGKEEMRVGHGGTGSRDTRDIPGSAVPAVLPATGVCLHLAPAFPVSTEGRNDGNSLDAVSQQDTEPRSEGVTPAGAPAAALAVALPTPHTECIPEALLSTVLFYFKQMTSPVRALLISEQLPRILKMLL